MCHAGVMQRGESPRPALEGMQGDIPGGWLAPRPSAQAVLSRTRISYFFRWISFFGPPLRLGKTVQFHPVSPSAPQSNARFHRLAFEPQFAPFVHQARRLDHPAAGSDNSSCPTKCHESPPKPKNARSSPRTERRIQVDNLGGHATARAAAWFPPHAAKGRAPESGATAVPAFPHRMARNKSTSMAVWKCTNSQVQDRAILAPHHADIA